MIECSPGLLTAFPPCSIIRAFLQTPDGSRMLRQGMVEHDIDRHLAARCGDVDRGRASRGPGSARSGPDFVPRVSPADGQRRPRAGPGGQGRGFRRRPGHLLPAHRAFGDFRGRSEAEWRNWLRSILVRRLAHQRRRYCLTSKRRQGLEVSISTGTRRGPASRDPTPSRELARREREAALLAAVDRLPEHYREVVIWHHRERLPFEEIGRRRGISAEAARKLWTARWAVSGRNSVRNMDHPDSRSDGNESPSGDGLNGVARASEPPSRRRRGVPDGYRGMFETPR